MIQQQRTKLLQNTTLIPLVCLDNNNNNNAYFSTSAKKSKPKKKSPKDKATNGLSLHEEQKQEKLNKKQKRATEYNNKIERQMKLKYRRMKPETIIKKNYLKNKFKSWFDKKREWEYIQEKLAKKSGRFDGNLNDAWLIKVAIVVERLPLVIPDPPDWEKDFTDLKERLDSFKSMFPADTPYAELNVDGEGLAIKTERTLWKSITEDFELLPRVTEADEENDMHSLNRKLHTRLFLTTPETINDDKNKSSNTFNMFPTTTVQKDETLIQACRRIVSEKVGDDLILYTPSNCPMAVNMYLHDHNVSKHWGEKIFIFRCHRDIGDIDESIITKDDYAWLDKEEIVDQVTNDKDEYHSKMYHYLL